ncbi:MAG: acyltransferase [Acidobacteriota bacterium]|nr:acyltransferase [Acidobacteriota bacterium]
MPSTRIPSLDGLRALSIAFVLFGHLALTVGFPVDHSWWTDAYAHYGVRIFFVISGYLITTLLIGEREKTGTINLKQFYIRRAYRILPAAYFYMIVVTIIFYSSLPWKYLVTAYTYLTSYAVDTPWVLRHLWSLSVEEQFYFAWPAAMLFGVFLAPRLAFGAIAFAPLLRLVLTKIGPPLGSPAVVDSIFPCNIDSLAAGCLLALYQTQFRQHRSFFVWRGFPLVWAFTMSIPVLQHYHYVFNFWHMAGLVQISALSVFNLGIILCIQNAITVPPRVLNTAVMVWVGNLSYSLYLWNMPFTNPYVQSWATAFPQNLVLTLLAATISFYAVEQPIRQLRERRAKRIKSVHHPAAPETAPDLVEAG